MALNPCIGILGSINFIVSLFLSLKCYILIKCEFRVCILINCKLSCILIKCILGFLYYILLDRDYRSAHCISTCIIHIVHIAHLCCFFWLVAVFFISMLFLSQSILFLFFLRRLGRHSYRLLLGPSIRVGGA